MADNFGSTAGAWSHYTTQLKQWILLPKKLYEPWKQTIKILFGVDMVDYELLKELNENSSVQTYNPYTCKLEREPIEKDVWTNMQHIKKNTKRKYTGRTNYPTTIYQTKKDGGGFHPTAKPVALMEHLIKMYTNEHDLVLDFTMGSGSTGVACKKTARDFIGIELDPHYFKIAEQRINETQQEKSLIDILNEQRKEVS